MTGPKGSGEVTKFASAVVGMATAARCGQTGSSGAKPRAMETDAKYFRRRAREEFFAAIRADHHKARRAHLDMAARYEDLLRALDLPEPAPPKSVEFSDQVTEHVNLYV